MIPVEQTILGGDTTSEGERGDCLRACIASIFELPIASVPHFVAEDDWWGALNRWVEARGFALGTAFMSVDDDDPTKLNGYPGAETIWIATVYSPRITRDDGTPGLHAVVMQGKTIAWDPHPHREMGHLGFSSGYIFRAPDPARLALR
jgi:hypothetical protein